MIKKIFKRLRGFNRVVIYLSLSDVFTWGSYSVISILSGIYLAEKLGADTLEFLGIGTSIYLFTRAALQIPIGLITDKYKHDKDEIYILFIGVLLMGLPYLFYPYITVPLQYYVLQFVFGIGVSLNLTNWRKLFALNIDKGKEGIQYGIYDLIMSIISGLLCILAGYISNMGGFYFDIVISLSGVFIMLGSIWVILIYKYDSRKSNGMN